MIVDAADTIPYAQKTALEDGILAVRASSRVACAVLAGRGRVVRAHSGVERAARMVPAGLTTSPRTLMVAQIRVRVAEEGTEERMDPGFRGTPE